MPKPVISVEHLTKQYDLGVISTGTLTRDLERWWARLRGQPDPYTRIGQKDAFERMGESILALDDVSFKVEQGEALGIIGKNGAGKSTLLKILSRVTAPSSGVVKVRGRIGSLLEVGTGFHPELTGRENVYLNGAILGMKKAEVTRKFDEIVDFSGVEKFIDTPVKRYSSGMYVRLAFAVAAHLDPEILIVDEVLAVGDAEFQKKCLGKMGDVAGEGRTVLFVSHNMGAIEALCNNGLLIEKGLMIFHGDIKKTIRKYGDSFLIFDRKTTTKMRERDGSQKIEFTQIELINNFEQPIDFISSGDDLHLRFSYKSNIDVSPSDVNFEVRCFSRQNNSIIFMHSMKYSGFWTNLKKLPIIGKVNLNINNLNLKPGDYRIMALIKINDQISDSIDDAVELKIYDPKIHHSGVSYSNLPVTILVDGSWELK